MKINYNTPTMINISTHGEQFVPSLVQQYISFSLDQTSCFENGPVLTIVKGITDDCVEPSQFATYLSRDTTFTCQGDAKTYQLLTTAIVVGGSAPCPDPAIRTLSFPLGAPQGTCVVETLFLSDVQGDLCV